MWSKYTAIPNIFPPQHSYRNEMFIEVFFCFRDHVLRDRRGEMRKLTDVELLKYTHWWGLQLKERDSLKKIKKIVVGGEMGMEHGSIKTLFV